MKVLFSLTCALLVWLTPSSSIAQTSQRSVVIGTMTSKPNAVLVLNPTDNNQGFLLPQLSTTSRLAMTPTSPDEDGLLVFDITEKQFYYWKNGKWVQGFSNNGNSGNGSGNGSGTTSPTVQFESIDPSDFSGLRSTSAINKTNALIFDDNTTYITTLKTSDGTSLIAPIHLPDGASIQQITVFFMDRDAQNIKVNVYRRAFAATSDLIVPTWTSTGNSAAVQSAVLTPIPNKNVVDNSTYSYRIVVQLNPSQDTSSSSDATQRIYGVQIQYQK